VVNYVAISNNILMDLLTGKLPTQSVVTAKMLLFLLLLDLAIDHPSHQPPIVLLADLSSNVSVNI